MFLSRVSLALQTRVFRRELDPVNAWTGCQVRSGRSGRIGPAGHSSARTVCSRAGSALFLGLGQAWGGPPVGSQQSGRRQPHSKTQAWSDDRRVSEGFGCLLPLWLFHGSRGPSFSAVGGGDGKGFPRSMCHGVQRESRPDRAAFFAKDCLEVLPLTGSVSRNVTSDDGRSSAPQRPDPPTRTWTAQEPTA